MTKNILFIVLEKLLKLSKKAKLKFVLMGGIAVSVFGRPRATYDIDGIIYIQENDLKNFLSLLRGYGFKFDSRHPIKYIQGLPYITFY